MIMINETHIFDGIVTAFLAVIAWISKRLHARVDELEKDKASKEDLAGIQKVIQEHRQESNENFKELRTLILKIYTKDE